MNRSRWLGPTGITLFVLATGVAPALAQVFNDPTFHVWGWKRPAGATVGPRMTNLIFVDGYGYTPQPVDNYTPDLNPAPDAPRSKASQLDWWN